MMKSMMAALTGALLLGVAHAQTSSDGFGTSWGGESQICHNDGDEDATPRDESYARSVIWDRMVLGDTFDECQAVAPLQIDEELTSLDQGRWGVSQAFSGTDDEGRTATFRLYVLNTRFSWAFNSSQAIEFDEQPADLNAVLAAPGFFGRFCDSNAAFGVGAASFEGPTAGNHRLAGRRADRITSRLAEIRDVCGDGKLPILFNLNLGENQNEVPVSSIQRRVVVIAAEDITLGVDLPGALRNALEQQSVFREVSLAEYDLFTIDAM